MRACVPAVYRIRMSRRASAILSVVVLLPCVTSCSSGPEHAATKFNTVVTGDRLFEAYGQTEHVTKTVSPARTTRQFILSMDCIGPKGSIKIALTGRPGLKAVGDIPCGEKANRGGPDGSIGIELGKNDVPPQVKVVITAPKGSEWSAAVDTRTGA